MDTELLLVVMKFAEALVKEGQPISRESIISNWPALSKNSPELSKIFGPTERLSPTQRHANTATSRHIKDACSRRDQLARELASTQESHALAMSELRRESGRVITSHRNRLDWFEPNYEGLKRDYDNIKALNFWSLFMITLGGVFIGVASFLPWDVLKFVCLGSGATGTIYGLWTQRLIVSKSPPSKDRPDKV